MICFAPVCRSILSQFGRGFSPPWTSGASFAKYQAWSRRSLGTFPSLELGCTEVCSCRVFLSFFLTYCFLFGPCHSLCYELSSFSPRHPLRHPWSLPAPTAHFTASIPPMFMFLLDAVHLGQGGRLFYRARATYQWLHYYKKKQRKTKRHLLLQQMLIVNRLSARGGASWTPPPFLMTCRWAM